MSPEMYHHHTLFLCSGKRCPTYKVIILDEADSMTSSAQVGSLDMGGLGQHALNCHCWSPNTESLWQLLLSRLVLSQYCVSLAPSLVTVGSLPTLSLSLVLSQH